jgi:hypothetical protein
MLRRVIEIDRLFRCAYYLRQRDECIVIEIDGLLDLLIVSNIRVLIEAVSISETSLNFYEITRRNIQDSLPREPEIALAD